MRTQNVWKLFPKKERKIKFLKKEEEVQNIFEFSYVRNQNVWKPHVRPSNLKNPTNKYLPFFHFFAPQFRKFAESIDSEIPYWVPLLRLFFFLPLTYLHWKASKLPHFSCFLHPHLLFLLTQCLFPISHIVFITHLNVCPPFIHLNLHSFYSLPPLSSSFHIFKLTSMMKKKGIYI